MKTDVRKITIWDMDFYHKKSFLPNPIAMKISSFHKQQGDLINFVTEEYHINMSFDAYYIIKEKRATPRPPGKLIDDKRVRLIGASLRFFDNYWEPPAIISAVRPDYLLYPERKNDAYYNAHILQFYHDGMKLKKKQPVENVLTHHRKTLVVDREFWSASDENVISCLQELEDYANVSFLHPIDFKKILKNDLIKELFINLHYSQGTIFKFRNNYGSSFSEAKEIFDFMEALKSKHEHVRFGNVPFKAVTCDHWSSRAGAHRDLLRALMIINEAKKRKVYIRMVSPSDRGDSPFWYYFETLEYWTLYLPQTSYVEMMLWSAMKRSGRTWNEIINNPLSWFTPNTYFLLTMITKTRWVEKYGLRQWGGVSIEGSMIEWKKIRKEYKGIQDPEIIELKEEDEWQK